MIIFSFLLVSLLNGNDYPVQPVPFTEVRLHDDFWAPRIETNWKVTIPYAFKQCEDTGRIDNFAIAGGLMEGQHKGSFPFDDTDAYKIIEGASYALAAASDPELDQYLDALIKKIAAAQEEDGYLYTCRTNGAEHLERWYGPERWTRLRGSHELYNAGHLYEAAAAHFLATGKRTLLEVAIRNADLVNKVFGPEKSREPPGHQIIEMGLCRLYRVTGEERYLALARFFLDMRGQEGRELWGEYNQDHAPVLDQDEAKGHAVRATYMYAGMADVAALTGDEDYLEAIDRIWENVVGKKLYLTGGVGARGNGEAFGDNYELPNMSAYCETCAAIGNVYWNHRLFLLHGEGKYIDVMERTLYNAFLSGISLDGRRFFYPNPLESVGHHERSPWFGCACCPGNVTRFIASVPGYVYAHGNKEIYVNLFVEGEATVNGVKLVQETRYPWDGHVRITVSPEEKKEFALLIRIPGWARNEPVPGDLYSFMYESDEAVTVNGEELSIDDGYCRIEREWKNDEVIDLVLPMPVRRVVAHEKVKSDLGKVALQRGPLVFCAEWPDNDGHVLNLYLPDVMTLQSVFNKDLLGGVQVVNSQAVALRESEAGLRKDMNLFTAIPYYAWAHRGKGEMAVWLAREEETARPLGRPTIASTSEVKVSGGTNPGAMNDRLEASASGDHSVPFFHWWPSKGKLEWVQYDFESIQEVSMVEVYWFDDTGRGECRLPASWRILYRDGEEWRPVFTTDEYGVKIDQYNKVTFETVRTDAIRLEVQLVEKFSAGIHEWRVE